METGVTGKIPAPGQENRAQIPDKAAVRRCFDAWADDWDSKLKPDPEKLNRLLDLAQIGPGSSVLDVACGTGVLFPFYIEREVSCIYGVDLSQNMLRIAREKFSSIPAVTLCCADAETVRLPKRFDRCVIFNALPHFSSPEALFRNLQGCLVRGGRLTVAHDHGRAALAEHHKTVSTISCELPSAESLAALLRECGFAQTFAQEDAAHYLVTGVLI